MSDSTDSPDSPGIPAFSALAADPEIAPLLDFVPVVRKVRRPDGWTPELQRELIARLAATGTVQAAVWQMGKHATGAEALYKTPSADSFRAAWDDAVAIGRRRNGLDSRPPHAGPVPGIARRAPKSAPPADEWADDEEPEIAADDDGNKLAVAESIVRKYLAKVRAEREARLEGRIVEADFTLRQVTCLEVALDLLATELGFSGFALLLSARRGGRSVLDIAETPFSRALDEQRRRMWAEAGEPERPEHPPQRYLTDQGDYSLEPGHHATGAMTPPAAGFTPGQWAEMTHAEQMAARDAEFEAEAEKQIAYERRAHEEAAAWRLRVESGNAAASSSRT